MLGTPVNRWSRSLSNFKTFLWYFYWTFHVLLIFSLGITNSYNIYIHTGNEFLRKNFCLFPTSFIDHINTDSTGSGRGGGEISFKNGRKITMHCIDYTVCRNLNPRLRQKTSKTFYNLPQLRPWKVLLRIVAALLLRWLLVNGQGWLADISSLGSPDLTKYL